LRSRQKRENTSTASTEKPQSASSTFSPKGWLPATIPVNLGNTGPLKHYWSYRVGDYRPLCEIVDEKVTVLVLEVSNRRDIYR
jgi:hypothetical protein